MWFALCIIIYHAQIARTLRNLQLAISKRYLVKSFAVETISDKFRSRQTGETKHPSNSRGQ